MGDLVNDSVVSLMEPGATRTLALHKNVLVKNAEAAARNRELFRAHGLWVVNLLSGPGAGKTTLLARTLADLMKEFRCGVIVGDLATDNDAQRLAGKGAPIVQINTGSLCHLEAEMIARAAAQLDLTQLDLLFLENVGNLVCPAGYDLGEACRAVLLCVTEGEDKPLKYPVMYKTAEVVLLTKTDLADATGFDREQALHHLGRIAPQASVLELSARTGLGLPAWYDLLRRRHEQRRRA